MHRTKPIELADQYSRKRALVFAVAALVFLFVHVVLRPFFYARIDSTAHGTVDWWTITVVILLAGLATGGGLLNGRRIRALVNDEVARGHYQTAIGTAYWVAMTAAMSIYLWPAFRVTAREAIYVVVTSSLGVALLTFAYLERRAHRDA